MRLRLWLWLTINAKVWYETEVGMSVCRAHM